METSSKKRIIILSATSILLTSLICLFAFRNVILCHIVDKRTTRAEQTYGLQIHYQELRMKGCNEVALQGLSIVPNQRDTLLTLQSVNVKLSFWELLKGEIEVRNVLMNGLAINFIKHDSIANYDFLFFKRQQEAEPQPVIESDYANRIDRILNLIYGFLPENGQLSQINITERKDSNFVAVNHSDKRRYTASTTMGSHRRTKQKRLYIKSICLCPGKKKNLTTLYYPPFWSRSHFRHPIL